VIVATPVASAIVALVADESSRLKVSASSVARSLVMLTVTVWLTAPGANVKVPEVDV
jgi:hypothetical protein